VKVTVLGSGTLLPDDRRHSPAHLVETDELLLLLDCGSGTVHGFDRHRVSWRRITHIAVSHFHTDHVGDLAPLIFALKHGVRPPRDAPLVLLGPTGLRAFLRNLAAAHGPFVQEPGFPVEVVELDGDGGRWADPTGRVTLAWHPTPHTEASLAYRVETGEGAVGYSGDTGPSEGVAAFLSGVALLIAECSLEDPPSMDTHLSPATLARLATRAAPDLLLVTHLYPPLRPHRVPEQVRAAGYEGPVVVAQDGTTVEVRGGRARLTEG
jgi:ribonuclease BN (tRNA processing enzyme)